MIKRIRIRNFKSLQDVSVELNQFNVLIGQNGAGKSSFLQALQVLGWLVRYGSINDALMANGVAYSELVYLRASSSTIRWDIELEISDPSNPGRTLGAVVDLRLSKRKHVLVSAEFVYPTELRDFPLEKILNEAKFCLGRSGRKTMIAQELGDPIIYKNVTLAHSLLRDVRDKPEQFPILSSIAYSLGSFMHYEIWGPEFLRQASTGASLILSERGQNLPSVLHTLKTRFPDRYRNLVVEMQGAYPWLDSMEIKRLGEKQFALSFLEKAIADKRKRRVKYQPSQVSDGFLRLLALTMLKYQPAVVATLGYEEPENGMHPGMLLESVKRLRAVAKAGTQVIVTTHSPLLLQDMLSEEVAGDPEKELHLVWRDKQGKTVIRPPRPKILKQAAAQDIGLGELWSMMLDEEAMAAPPLSGGSG